MIIALDTNYKTLLFHEIEADLLVVVDPQKINSKYIENISLKNQPILICEPAVCPRGIRNFKNVIMFDTIFPYYNYLTQFFGKKGEVDMGGSVATTAYEVLQKMGCSGGTFTGLDLCYTNDAYHIEGTMYEEYWFSSLHRTETFEMKTNRLLSYQSLQKIKNRENKIAFMDAKFTLFKNWFERKLKQNTLNVYNSSKTAINMENLPYLSLEDFLKKYAKKPIDKKRFKKNLLKQNPSSSVEKTKLVFFEALKKIVENISNYKIHAEKATEVSEKIIRRLSHSQNIGNLKKQVGTLDAKLQQSFLGKDFVNIAIQGIIQEVTGEKKSDGTTINLSEEEKVLKISIKLYKEIALACTLNEKYLKNIIKN